MEQMTNNPPSPIEFARETIGQVNSWLSEHPVIQTEDDAREAKVWADRAKEALRDVELERVSKVEPLNAELIKINGSYKALHNTDKAKPGQFDRVMNELKARIDAFLAAEEEKRQKTAQEAAERAAEAERLAREAEAKEREALSNAAVGEAGVDVAEATSEADAKFAEFEKAAHEAAIAERDSHVCLGGGFGRALSRRNKEVLSVDDPVAAVQAMWPSDKISEAILSAARAFRQVLGDLPPGVSSSHERSL